MALSDYTQIASIIQLSTAPKATWDSEDPILPEGMPGWESDTKKMKIGDGVTTWTGLAYTVDATLTPEQKALLDNAGAANGVSVLDANGLIPLDTLPDQAKSHIKYIADIPSRDAVDEADRHFIYVVLDASGDATVESGAATYSWDDTNSVWVKLSEFESMDIDFSVFFNKTTETLDDIADGTQYIRFTPAERTKLAKAMVTDETYRFVSLSPAEINAAMAE
jgi:hypothetical protein